VQKQELLTCWNNLPFTAEPQQPLQLQQSQLQLFDNNPFLQHKGLRDSFDPYYQNTLDIHSSEVSTNPTRPLTVKPKFNIGKFVED